MTGHGDAAIESAEAPESDPRGEGDVSAGGRTNRVVRGTIRFFLGPWPLFPWVVFLGVFIFLLLQNMQVSLMGRYESCRFACVDLPAQFTPAISGQYGEAGLEPFDPVLVLGNALATSAVIAMVMVALGRFLRKDPEGCPSRGSYLLVLLAAAVAGGLTRIYVLSPVLIASPSMVAAGIFPNTLRTFVTITAFQSLSGLLVRRYVRQTAVATGALETVVQQQRLVVESDERARRQVAEFLHDRVQADLLVVALELRSVSEDVDEHAAARLGAAIAELERVRGEEVRSASRRLSPAFGSVGLDTALQDLADSWESVVDVRVHTDVEAAEVVLDSSVSRDLLIAVYRVTEQAILNSASHGRASRVDVSLRRPSSDCLLLTVSDDGRGLPRDGVVRGAGSAITDAWCAVARGSWAWVPSARGVRLEASFSL